MAADWSMLPLDPLGSIAMKFTIAEDFTRFSVVCQGWNRATSLVKHQWRASLPSILLAENPKENPDGLRKIFNLNNNQIFSLKLPETFGTRCWGSAYGWVAMVDDNRKVQLFNPITKAQIHFPSLTTLTHFDDDIDVCYKDEHMFLNVYLVKLIVLKVSQNDTYEFVIMVIYDNRVYLDFARHGDESWTPVSTKKFSMDPSRRWFTKVVDIVTKDDHIFALYGDGSTVHWHATEFRSGELLIPTDYSPSCAYEIVSRHKSACTSKYLVESQGDLIMVVRYTYEILVDNVRPFKLDCDIGYRTVAFDVFKLTKHKRWEKIEDLGNVALFTGVNYSMSISLQGECLQHNCIYFTDEQFDFWSLVKEYGGHDTGFYDMKRDAVQFYKHDDMRSLFCPSTWFIPKF